MMRYLQQSFIILVLSLVTTLFVLPFQVQAAGLSVDFGTVTPLFYDINIAPGVSVTRNVTVANTSTEKQSVYLDTKNTSSDGLADVMQLTVSSSTTSYLADSFSNLFATSQVSLGDLEGGESRIFTFTASLPTSTANTYQSSTMSFDLCVGFSGGDTECDSSGSTGTGTGTSGGSGGTVLRLYNENVSSVNPATLNATIAWDTNRNATSFVVCGDVENGPFNLSAVPPLFGYEFLMPEVSESVKSHVATVEFPDYGVYECRPASRESVSDDFTIGNALTIIIPFPEVAGASISYDGVGGNYDYGVGPDGEVLGASVSASSSSAEEKSSSTVVSAFVDEFDDVIANVFSEDEECTVVWLLLLAVMFIAWSLVSDRIKTNDSIFHSLFIRNLYLVGAFVGLVLAASWLLDITKIWWILLVLWAGIVYVDYRAHAIVLLAWNPIWRHIFYAVTGALFVGTSLLFDFPCQWLPFALVGSVAVLLAVFDR